MFSVFQCNLPTLTHTHQQQCAICNMHIAVHWFFARQNVLLLLLFLQRPFVADFLFFLLICWIFCWLLHVRHLFRFGAIWMLHWATWKSALFAYLLVFLFLYALLLKFALVFYAAAVAYEAQQSKCRSPTAFVWRLCAWGSVAFVVKIFLLLLLCAIVAIFISFSNFSCK